MKNSHPADTPYDIAAKTALGDAEAFDRLTTTQIDRNRLRVWLVGHHSRVISNMHVRKHAHETEVARGNVTDAQLADYHDWRNRAHGFKSLVAKALDRLGCNTMGYPLPTGDDDIDPTALGRRGDTLHSALVLLAGAAQRLLDAEAGDDDREYDAAHDYLAHVMDQVNVDEPGGRRSIAALLTDAHVAPTVQLARTGQEG